MLLYALNIRRDQMTPDGTAIRLPAGNLRAAMKNYLQYVMLFASSREEEPGYLGMVKILGIYPDQETRNHIWIELGPTQRFHNPVTLAQIYGKGHNQPFHRYAHAFRVVPKLELQRIFNLTPHYPSSMIGFAEDVQASFGAETMPSRADTSKLVRRAVLRFKMLELYGKECPFTLKQVESLDTWRCALQVGHVRPLWCGGSDPLPNVLPLSALVNWSWDEGLISLENNRKLLLAEGMTERSRRHFLAVTKIRPPRDGSTWPDAANLEFHRTFIFQKSAAERETLRQQFAEERQG